MLLTVLITTALCGLTHLAEGSVGHEHSAFALGVQAPPPVVTSASSQYFERIFNRVVATPVVAPAVPVLPEPPVIQAHAVLPPPTQFPGPPPVIQAHAVLPAPAQFPQRPPVIQTQAVLPVQAQFPQQPVFPAPQFSVNPVLQTQPSVIQTHTVLQPQAPPVQVQPVFPQRPFIQTHSVFPPQPQPRPPFFFQPVPEVPVPVNPSVNTSAPPNQPTDPNINIAIATAHAAAPVATILLPPFPFGPPPFGYPQFGFAPAPPQTNPEEPREEDVTPTTTSQPTVTEPEQTTPMPEPSNNDNSFAPLPSANNNFNFKYGPPQNVPFNYGPPPDIPRPIKPFPLQPSQFQQNRPQKLTTSVEIVPVPLAYMAPPPLTHPRYHNNPHHHHSSKIVKYYVRTVPAPVRAKIIIRPVSASPHKVKYVKSYKYRVPVSWERNDVIPEGEQVEPSKDREPTTMGPVDISNTKPPKL